MIDITGYKDLYKNLGIETKIWQLDRSEIVTFPEREQFVEDLRKSGRNQNLLVKDRTLDRRYLSQDSLHLLGL